MAKTKHDWSLSDAMTDEEILAAALADPDAAPIDDKAFARAKRTTRVKLIRRALKLSQEDFARRFRIPLGTLRDWEQGRKYPDAAARAYLVVIAKNPDAVSKAFEAA